MENRAALEVEVAPAPIGRLYSRKYTVYGDVQRYNFHNWLKQQALDHSLHGYVKSKVFDEIEIVVAGTDKETVSGFKKIIEQYPQGSNVLKINEESYEDPVTVGFEISEQYNTSNIKSVQYALRKMDKDLQRLKKQKDRIEKDNQHILSSTSWKYTEPIRKIKEAIKQK